MKREQETTFYSIIIVSFPRKSNIMEEKENSEVEEKAHKTKCVLNYVLCKYDYVSQIFFVGEIGLFHPQEIPD